MWQTIDTAPKGKYEKRTVMRQDKEVAYDEFVAPQLLLALDGKVYLTKALPSGRWNGFSEKDNPSHWMAIPEVPAPPRT
jgi:hypothetical protein